MHLRDSVATAVTLMSSLASAINFCPPNANKVCYSVNVPSSSAASGRGNIYFQIRAPTSYSWVALGTGGGMPNSNIFLVYQDGRGNMTVSPRRGTRYTPPSLDTSSGAARLTLLAGSGVSADGSTMTANIVCSNCQSWSGGSMSLSDMRSNWIGAWQAGNPLSTTSTSVGISQHDDTAVFNLDLTRATIQSDSNPFVGAGAGPETGSDNSNGNGGGNSGGGNGVEVISATKLNNNILIAHGAVMAIVFVILYPLASMLMPLLGKWHIHGGFQVFNFLLMWAGFALGYETAKERRQLFNNTHTILGTVVVSLLVLQPLLGFAHHRHYVRHQSRGAVSYAHVIYGQALIVVGIVNGGLGLDLAGVQNRWIVAYSVVAAVIFALYAAVKVFALLKARRSSMAGVKQAPSPDSDSRRRPYP